MQPEQAAAYCLYLETIVTLDPEGEQGAEASGLLDELLCRVSAQPGEWIAVYTGHYERLRKLPAWQVMEELPAIFMGQQH